MNKKLTTLIGATLAVCAYSSNAASIVGTPFSFAVDAAQDPLFSSDPGADNSVTDNHTADSPFTVSTTFDITTGQKFIGVLHYHNSAFTVGNLTGVSFGGQALDFSTRHTGGFGASVAITHWDATSDITDGTFSVTFDTRGIDEFSFSLYAVSGLVAGGPRDFSFTNGGTPTGVDAAAGDLIVSIAQGNNGNGNLYAIDSDLTQVARGAVGELAYYNGYAFADGNTLVADAGSPTGFVTSITNTNGTTNPLRLQMTASFEAIPEPSSALLGGIGMLLLMRRRR